MYVLLTKKENGSFDVPVRWRGSNIFSPELKEFTEVTFSKSVIHNGHLSHFGIFPFSNVPVPTGKRAKGDAVETFNGTSVSKEAPVEDDPDYVAPTPPTEEEIAKAAADSLAVSQGYKIAEVKSEAQKRILAVAPEWKQRNFSFLHQQISDKTKADAETSTATAVTTTADASTKAAKDSSDAKDASTAAATAHTDAQAAEATAKETAEAEGATDEQKAAYVTAQETTKTKEAEATKAEEDSKAAIVKATEAEKASTEAVAAAKVAKDAHDKEKADMVAQKTMWNKVDEIRSKSDEIEVKIAAMDQSTVDAFTVSTDANWE